MANSAPIQPQSFRVAIIGGGIGGLTTALALSTYNPGLDVTVFEQASAYREIGAGVGIGVNAGRVLQRLGVYKQARAISGARGGVHRCLRRYDNGEDITSVEGMNDPEGVEQLGVHRAEFLDVLLDAVKERECAHLETGKRAVHVAKQPHDNSVLITFADGTTASADLVVAADGIHSAIRSQFVTDKPEYSGRIAYRGLLPISAVAEDWPYPSYAVSWLAEGKHFLTFAVSETRLMNVVGFVCKPESELDDLQESWTSSAPRSDLEAEYEGWHSIVQKVISHMDPVVGKWKLNDRTPLSQWTFLDGKVVLLGDAAHAMLPFQGSGAGHSVEDASILGLALQDYFKNPPLGLKTFTSLYESMRLPRTRKAQQTSREAGAVYDMQGPAFDDLSYEDCLPLVHEKMSGRFRWIWGHDLEAEYRVEKAKVLNGSMNGTNGHASVRVDKTSILSQ